MSESNLLDLRVIELSKSSYADPLRNKLNQDNQNSFVCLGHFDYLSVERLSPDDPLEAIRKDFEKRDNYNYPLYIFHYGHKSINVLNDFWELRSCFMSVSRIHFNSTTQTNVGCLRDALNDLHQGQPIDDKQLGELTIRVDGELVHMVFYHTLELGDLVVVLKSNSIPSCLGAIRRMMEVAAVGDVYSFFGIHQALVKQDTNQAITEWIEAGKHIHFEMGIAQALNQLVPHASMRFSIRSISCAKEFWSAMGCSAFFIVGTADAIINLNGKPVKELIEHISRLIYENPKVDPNEEPISMYDAFEDIITRIGSEYREHYSGALSPKKRELPTALKNIFEKLHNSVNLIQKRDAHWTPILIAQIHTLSAMMDSCVTDDLSMLIWPSVRALLSRLEYLFNYNHSIKWKHEKEIGEFLNAWDIFENDISRLEGQLSQNPELLSSRYYIPATLVAFYMALLQQYNEFLLMINGESYGKYVPLITFNIDPRASTLCILDPSSDLEHNYKEDTPLCVSLPVSMMYQPLETVIVLCHEMSHYTGTSTRQRTRRYDYILESFAARIIMEWKLDNSEYALKDNTGRGVIDAVINRLKELYCKCYGDNTDYYIDQLRRAFPEKIITQVFFDQELQTQLLHQYLAPSVVPHYVLKYSKDITYEKLHSHLDTLNNHAKNLLLLYRECYADLLAIRSLNLTPDEYLKYMFYSESLYIAKYHSDDMHNRLRELQLQTAVVLYVIQNCKLTLEMPTGEGPEVQSEINNIDQWLIEWKKQINYFQSYFVQGKNIPHPDRRNSAIMIQIEHLALVQYLKECNNVISNELKKEATKSMQNELGKIFDAVRNGFDIEKVHTAVADYRKMLLI